MKLIKLLSNILGITIFALIIFGVGLIIGFHWDVEPQVDKQIPSSVYYTLDDRLDAIEWVESRGDTNAVGSCGEAGAYQLSKIYVDDVNRILGLWDLEMRFSYDDRWDRDKSRMMTKIFTDYWVCHHIVNLIRVGVSSNEAAVRIHNGGPNGWQKDCTKAYWQKVKARLEYEGD